MYLGEENEEQEFKESLGQLDDGLKALTAMLNRGGHGAVYYGVKDNGAVLGMTVSKKTLVDIRIRIKDRIEPQIMPVIENLTDETGKHFIKVSANGFNRPYSYDGRYFLRTAASNERISTSLLRRMLISGTTDLISEMDSEEQNLIFNGFISFLSQKGIHARDERSFYQSAGFYNHTGKYNFMAYLLSDENTLNLKVVRFSGTDKSVMSERTEFGGQCLLTSLMQVFTYVTGLITVKVSLENGIRRETELFDKESFREAWINACVHNAWSEKIAPSVFIFDDRIEIVSYGSIPYDLTMTGFFAGTSIPVNNGLFTIFSNADLSEQTGHGIPTIVSHYGREAFSFEDNMLKVTLKYAFEPEFAAVRRRRINEYYTRTRLNANQLKIYEYVKQYPDTTLAQAASDNGLSLSGTKKIIQKLKELDLIERTGSRKTGKWITK